MSTPTTAAPVLTDAHREYLIASGIDAGWLDAHPGTAFSYDADTNLPDDLAWARRHCDTGLAYRWRQADGTDQIQLHPDTLPPAEQGARPAKYVGPRKPDGEEIAPLRYGLLSDTGRPIHPVWVVEGTKQSRAAAAALAARSAGAGYATVIGIPGITAWQRGVPADIRDRFTGREVIIVPDADAARNPEVYDGAKALGDNIRAQGAAKSVKYVQLPSEGSARDGLDDVLARLATPQQRAEALVQLGETAYRAPAANRPKQADYDAEKALVRQADAPRDPARLYPTESYLGEDGSVRAQFLARTFADQFGVANGLSSPVAVWTHSGAWIDGPDAQRTIRTIFTRTLGDRQNPARLAALTQALDAETHVLPQKLWSGLHRHPIISVANGLLDISTGTLHPHNPKYLSTIQLPVAYDARATCPTYDRWILDRCGEDQARTLDAIGAQIIDPSRTPSKSVMLCGQKRTGKSTWLSLASAIVGDKLLSAVALEDIEKPHMSHELHGKLLNVCGDIDDGDLGSISVFKQLTGGDPITANPKYGQPYRYVNLATLAYSANRVPSAADAGGAYLARMVPVAFPRTYFGSEDPRVGQALLSELPGILNRWVRAYGQRPEAHPFVQEVFTGQTDRVARFVACCTTACEVEAVTDAAGAPLLIATTDVATPGAATGTQLYAAFRRWMEAEGSNSIMGRNTFLARLGDLPGARKTRVGPTRREAFTLRVLPSADWTTGDTGPEAIEQAIFGSVQPHTPIL